MIEMKDLVFGYSKDSTPVLDGIAFSVQNGTVTAVLGNNGAGKSTLLKCIDRILTPLKGEVLIDGEDIHAMSRRQAAMNIAYVAQNASGMDMSVFDAVLLGRKPYIKWDITDHDREVVLDVLERMHLSDYSLRKVSELSGGEAQKVMLAMALAQETKVLLLDEPTSSLDPKNQHEVMQTVRSIAREHDKSVITVIHDLNLAIRYCDSFLFIRDSKVFAQGGMEVMNPENIEAVYDMHVHIVDALGIPVIIPYPDAAVGHDPSEHTEHGHVHHHS